ncbi:DUF3126 family protein [Acetobacteraceae bacterium]|nr:DUF3126 family protein [Acetobacteraceae bacterium]
MADFTQSEISRLEAGLQKLLKSPDIRIPPVARKGVSVEVLVGDETIGTVYKDEEDGEVSYAVNITLLQEDLPEA